MEILLHNGGLCDEDGINTELKRNVIDLGLELTKACRD